MRTFLIATALATVACTSRAQSVVRNLSPSQQAAIDSLVHRTMDARRVPGVAIAIIDSGRAIFQKAYGFANLETKTPLATTSVFELASLTKEFTAAEVMMLVGEGKVMLDAPITAYLDSAPPAWNAITVRQLLTHTSGIFAGGVVFAQGSPLLNITRAQALNFVAGARTFPPGQVAFYSDAGYLLLGAIIEKTSGQTWRDFTQQRIFAPLGMTHSSVVDRRRVLEGRVNVYDVVAGQVVNWRRDWDHELPSFFGIFSTLGDLMKWDNALRDHVLLPQRVLDSMWTPAKLMDGSDALVDARQYGFGFRIDQMRGHQVVWHNGASGTLIMHLLEEPLTVIVLTNLANTAGTHAPILTDGLVGIVRPAYAPVQKLTPGVDPTPATTTAMRALLADIGSGQPSVMMTPSHASFFSALPQPTRDALAAQMRDLSPLTYVACDNVEGKQIRITDPIARICYYKAAARGQTTFFTFWLTREDKAALMRTSPGDAY